MTPLNKMVSFRFTAALTICDRFFFNRKAGKQLIIEEVTVYSTIWFEYLCTAVRIKAELSLYTLTELAISLSLQAKIADAGIDNPQYLSCGIDNQGQARARFYLSFTMFLLLPFFRCTENTKELTL